MNSAAFYTNFKTKKQIHDLFTQLICNIWITWLQTYIERSFIHHRRQRQRWRTFHAWWSQSRTWTESAWDVRRLLFSLLLILDFIQKVIYLPTTFFRPCQIICRLVWKIPPWATSRRWRKRTAWWPTAPFFATLCLQNSALRQYSEILVTFTNTNCIVFSLNRT